MGIGKRGGRAAAPLLIPRTPLVLGGTFIVLLALVVLSAPDPAIAGGTMSVSVSAVIPAASNCRFRTASATLDFGLLDPGNPANAMVNATVGFRCNGGPRNVTFAISSNDGLHESSPGAPRMRHNVQLTEFLPYSLAWNPASGTVPRNQDQLLTVTGTVLGASYGSAAVGAYSDTVTLSILP